MHLNQHDCTIAGGCVGLAGSVITFYLKNIDAINGVLQTLLIALSIAAVVIGWLKKGKEK